MDESRNRTLLFSVTAKDCVFIPTKGSGKGGQKRNKTSNAMYCKHPPSGAMGYAEDTRSQDKNKRLAFVRMAKSKKFKLWSDIEAAKKMGVIDRVQTYVEQEMNNPSHVRIEVKDEKGRWVEENSL